MQIVVYYIGGKSYGPGFNARSYAARINGDDKMINISSRFSRGLPGRTKDQSNEAQVAGFDLTLDHDEAIHLATAILAYVHHPLISDAESIWFAPEEGELISMKEWEGKIKVRQRDADRDRVQFVNDTRFYLNSVTVEFTFTNEDDGVEWRHQIRFKLNLPSSESCECILGFEDDDASRIAAMRIVSAKGMTVPAGWGAERMEIPRPIYETSQPN